MVSASFLLTLNLATGRAEYDIKKCYCILKKRKLKKKFKVYWIRIPLNSKSRLLIEKYDKTYPPMWGNVDHICFNRETGEIVHERGTLRVYMLAAAKGIKIRAD